MCDKAWGFIGRAILVQSNRHQAHIFQTMAKSLEKEMSMKIQRSISRLPPPSKPTLGDVHTHLPDSVSQLKRYNSSLSNHK